MEVVEFMQDNAISIAVAGAVAIVVFIVSKTYEKIVVERNGTKMIFLKNQNSVDKNVIQDFGNIRRENKKIVKNHQEKYGDKINITKGTGYKNVGNFNIINNEEVEGGETEVCRIIGEDG